MHISDPLLRTFLTAGHVPDPFAAAGRTAEVPKATLAVHRSITFVACLLRNTRDALRIRRNRRAAFRELSALPDATLKDIGLPRSEIRYVAGTLKRPAPDWRPCLGRGVKPVAANDDEAEAAA